jgi:protein SYS1
MPPRRRKPPRAGALADLPPLSILRSILLLQLSYYVVATVLILFTTLVAGQKFSVGLVLDWRTVRGDNTVGWMLGVVWLLVSLFAYVASLSFSISFWPSGLCVLLMVLLLIAIAR